MNRRLSVLILRLLLLFPIAGLFGQTDLPAKNNSGLAWTGGNYDTEALRYSQVPDLRKTIYWESARKACL